MDIGVHGKEGQLPVRICYARYADDLLFGILLSEEIPSALLRKYLIRTCLALKLESTFSQICRCTKFSAGKFALNLQVLGLVVSLATDGSIKTAIPKKRWIERMTTEKILSRMDQPQPMSHFLEALHEHVDAYLRYSFLYSQPPRSQGELYRFFQSIVLDRSSDFVHRTHCSISGVEGQTIWKVRDQYLKDLKGTASKARRGGLRCLK